MSKEEEEPQVGVTREQFYEWLDTCPIGNEWVLVAENDYGYCRVVFCFDETGEVYFNNEED
jgi:hypothetical protein